MTTTEKGERLSVFVDQTDQHGGGPLYVEIVHRARQAGLAGATVLHGVEGFGASTHLHAPKALRLSQNLPVIVVIVDRPERIAAFVPVLDSLVVDGLVVRQPVQIVVRGNR